MRRRSLRRPRSRRYRRNRRVRISKTVTTDPRRVQQILINMLTNACKHTAKGEIKLTYSTADEPGFIQFSVTDTGTGVPADQAEAIFGRFTKLNEFVQGTGLGLSICREIAEKMGGKVSAKSSPVLEKLHADFRKEVPFVEVDTYMHPLILRAAGFIRRYETAI